MTELTLGEKIDAYLSRNDVPKFDFNREGVYIFESGSTSKLGDYKEVRRYHGKFIDVVAAAVQDDMYGGFYIPLDTPQEFANSENGRVITEKEHSVEIVEEVPHLREYLSISAEHENIKELFRKKLEGGQK